MAAGDGDPAHPFTQGGLRRKVHRYAERMRQSEGKPRLKINPKDAGPRQIADGKLVRLHDRPGECFLYAEVTADVLPGVLVAESIWWAKHHPGGMGINQLTSQRLTDPGEYSTLHVNPVNVERAAASAGT